MQWIFMLVGLVLGALADETLTASLLGALIGLGLGQALKLQGLARENAALTAQLKAFSQRFEQGTAALYERLLKLEQAATPAAEAPPVSEPISSVAEPAPEPEPIVSAQAAQPELDWTLDFVLPEVAPEPVMAMQASPQPADAAPIKPPPATPWKPAEPRQPTLLERGFTAAKDWLLGGNTVLRVGVVLLFLGLAFLLRYATEGVVVPVELRYASVAASAVALLALGWWLRLRNPNYALMLQGTGIAVLYLTVFAAMRLHPLLEPGGRRSFGRFRRADPDVYRQRQSCGAVQLLRPAQCRDLCHRLVQGLAPAQPDRFCRHLRHRFRLGHPLLHAGTAVEHRTVSDSVLPDVCGHRSAVCPAQAARSTGCARGSRCTAALGGA